MGESVSETRGWLWDRLWHSAAALRDERTHPLPWMVLHSHSFAARAAIAGEENVYSANKRRRGGQISRTLRQRVREGGGRSVDRPKVVSRVRTLTIVPVPCPSRLALRAMSTMGPYGLKSSTTSRPMVCMVRPFR